MLEFWFGVLALRSLVFGEFNRLSVRFGGFDYVYSMIKLILKFSYGNVGDVVASN